MTSVPEYLRFRAHKFRRAATERLARRRIRDPFLAAFDPVLREDGAAFIEDGLRSGRPFVAARFGTSESLCTYEYVGKTLGLRRGYSAGNHQRMTVNAGFFPGSEDGFDRFSRLMIECVAELDYLGDVGDVGYLARLGGFQGVTGPYHALEPYYDGCRWSRALAGKRVLVIHPYATLIEAQYAKRQSLFDAADVLPEFELITQPAVQSIAGTKVPFDDWFAALEFMVERARDTDFDVAIIGAGAYGMPLAVEIKRMGRQALHMGGATQLLFGIRGRRWDAHSFVSHLYNDHWASPGDDLRPEGFERVEGGCYW